MALLAVRLYHLLYLLLEFPSSLHPHPLPAMPAPLLPVPFRAAPSFIVTSLLSSPEGQEEVRSLGTPSSSPFL